MSSNTVPTSPVNSATSTVTTSSIGPTASNSFDAQQTPKISFNKEQRKILFEIYQEKAKAELEIVKNLRDWTRMELEMAGKRKRQLDAQLAQKSCTTDPITPTASDRGAPSPSLGQSNSTEAPIVDPSIQGAIAIFNIIQGLPYISKGPRAEQIQAIIGSLSDNTTSEKAAVGTHPVDDSVERETKAKGEAENDVAELETKAEAPKPAVVDIKQQSMGESPSKSTSQPKESCGNTSVSDTDATNASNSDCTKNQQPESAETPKPAGVAPKISFQLNGTVAGAPYSQGTKRKRVEDRASAADFFLENLTTKLYCRDQGPPSPKKRAPNTPSPVPTAEVTPTGASRLITPVEPPKPHSNNTNNSAIYEKHHCDSESSRIRRDSGYHETYDPNEGYTHGEQEYRSLYGTHDSCNESNDRGNEYSHYGRYGRRY